MVENLFLEFLVHEFLSLLLVKHNGFALLSHSGSSKRLRLGVDPINLTFDLFLKKEKQIKILLIKKMVFSWHISGQALGWHVDRLIRVSVLKVEGEVWM